MIKERLNKVLSELPKGTTLIAVSKYHPKEAIQEAYDAGQRHFGESHVQELNTKKDTLPKDIKWHFIGHLQTNKVKYIIPYIFLIHSVDSIRLLNEINKQAIRFNQVINCLLEVHIAKENTKYGFSPNEVDHLFQAKAFDSFQNIRIVGLMCMATHTDSEDEIRKEFRLAHKLFIHLRETYFMHDDTFNTLSMGMSNDYLIAIEEGSTMVRVGTKIFGERSY